MADGRKPEVKDCDSRSDDYDEVKDRFTQRVNGKTSGMPKSTCGNLKMLEKAM